MAIPIILYDENHERVGETYHRRAKQLVKSGRAYWLEEGHSLRLASYLSADPPIKEEVPIMSESVFNNNGIAPDEPKATPPEASNDLLMYLARKNVAEKKSLFRHVVAYIIAWVVILSSFNFGGPVFRATNGDPIPIRTVQEQPVMHNIGMFEFRQPNSWFNIDEFLDELFYEMRFVLPNNWPCSRELFAYESGTSYIITPPHRGFALNEAGGTYLSAHSWPLPTTGSVRGYGLWHFIFGIMFAWGAWIAVRGCKIAYRHVKNKTPRSPRPDPVAMEYQRLRSMSVDGTV